MSSTTQSTRSRSSRGSIDSIALEMGRGSLSMRRSVSYSSNSAVLPLLDGDDEESRLGYNDEAKRYTQKLHVASENMSIVVSGMTTSTSGSVLYTLICTMTLGLGYLALRYLPRWRSYLTLSPSPLKRCDSIFIENQWGEVEVQKVSKINRDKSASLYSGFIFNDEDYKYPDNYHSDLRYFDYHYIRLIYHPAADQFVFASQWADPRWNDLDDVRNGLSYEEVNIRTAVFGGNLIDIEEKSTIYILLDEILHPFYLFQFGSLVLWALDDYLYYAACIFLISGMSILAALIETKATVRHLREISVFECKVRVIRNGFWRFMESSNLVPGDIYEVTDPDLSQVPCDSILLSGDCIMNESMLTGESVPVSKTPAAYDAMDHILESKTGGNSVAAKHMLFGGTHVVRARRPQESEGSEAVSLALVIRGGFNTTKGNLVRSMLFPKPTGFKFYSDSFRYIRVMAMVALVGIVMAFFELKRFKLSWGTITIRALDLVTIIVPPALPATLTIGSNFAVRRLKKNNIFCISPQRVNIGGKVNAVCFDKTGTLTEDDLNVYGLLGAETQTKRFGNLVTNATPFTKGATSPPEDLRKLSNMKSLFYTMAACHSLRHVKGSVIGDPLDIKMFNYTGWTFEENESPSGYREEEEQINLSPRVAQGLFYVPSDQDNQQSPLKQIHVELGIFRVFDYFPHTRRASVVARQYDSQEFYVYVKGAPESIHDICKSESLPTAYDKTLMWYTQQGFRVIACAVKRLPKFNWLKVQKISRQEAESNLDFIGLVIFENRMKPTTPSVISELNNAHIRNIMCTGDNIYTAISVAKDCGIVNRRTHCFVSQLKNCDSTGNLQLRWQSIDDASVALDGETLKPITSTNEHDTQSYHSTPNLYNCSFALNGEVFRWIIGNSSTDILNTILRYGQVFARMSPDDKHELVERLQSIDYCCAFCGDGANDCGALQAADVGISLSEAEASVAAPFTSRTYDITCVPNIIREGRAALVTSFSCFKYMSLYSAIQFISVSFLYNIASNFGDFQFLYIDLLVTLPLAIFMAWSEPYPMLVSKRPTASLMSRKVLTSLLGHITIILMMQSTAYFSVRTQSWFKAPIHQKDQVNILNSQNTALFLLSCYQYLYYSLVLNPGPPFRQPLIRNVPFLVTFIIIFSFTSMLLFKSPAWLTNLMQLTEMSISFKFLLFFLGFGCLVLGNYGEVHVFDRIALKLKELRNADSPENKRRSKSKKLYKSIPALQ